QIAAYNPASLILVDVSEYNLYRIDYSLTQFYPDLAPRIYPRLGSILDRHFLEPICQRFRPEVVFHAAAYKHVPLLEDNVCSAALNNILGTNNLLEVTLNHGVERFILISSDKAVNPVNIMGATKRCCELLVQTYHQRYSS